MRRCATTATLSLSILLAGVLPDLGLGDPPIGGVAVKYITVPVEKKYQGRSARWWAHRAVANRREANRLYRTTTALRAHYAESRRQLKVRFNRDVSYAIRLASRTFNVSESKMWSVARCESTYNPFATNGRYKGLFQLGWSPFGFSPYDPVANALSAAQTVSHDGSWRQWECG